MSSFKNLAVILRTWSNNKDIAKAVVRALNAGIGRIIVIVKDDDPSNYGNVEAWLAGAIEANVGRITVLPMRVGYSWSNALNYGFDEIRRLNLAAAVRDEAQIDYVLNVSNETLYEPSTVEAMVAEISSDASIGAVGTSFAGRQNGNAIDLGKSYIHPRNTMMLVRWTDYVTLGGFSPRCDQLGGQEDLDWLMRLEQKGSKWTLLDLKVPLLVGVNHHQPTKEAREMKAIAGILSMNAEITANFGKAIQRLY